MWTWVGAALDRPAVWLETAQASKPTATHPLMHPAPPRSDMQATGPSPSTTTWGARSLPCSNQNVQLEPRIVEMQQQVAQVVKAAAQALPYTAPAPMAGTACLPCQAGCTLPTLLPLPRPRMQCVD